MQNASGAGVCVAVVVLSVAVINTRLKEAALPEFASQTGI